MIDTNAELQSLHEQADHNKKVISVLHDVSTRINTKLDLELIFNITFQLLDDFFHLKHIMILLAKEDGLSLEVYASHGYDGKGKGAVVPLGVGVIGMVAKNRRLLRMANVASNMRYMRTVTADNINATATTPLPGLPNTLSQMGVPLMMNDTLVGVLYVESNTPGNFDKRDETLLQMVGVQIAIAINNARQFHAIAVANAQLHDMNENLEHKVTERTAQLAAEKAEVEKQKQRSEELLLNILPAEVAEELKVKGYADAKHITQATVLFTDFKGFTQLSEKLSPTALVAQINECFSAFDKIMGKYGVEKIKTIGDAYMAAGGLPTPNKTNADDVVKAALEIQQYMQDHKTHKEAAGELYFEIRIGVHTGSVVAGIVGIKKFAYDIWGDTVNTASRMESSGAVGKVNISETTYEIVKDNFSCTFRGELEAKNKGKMKMYFVE